MFTKMFYLLRFDFVDIKNKDMFNHLSFTEHTNKMDG